MEQEKKHTHIRIRFSILMVLMAALVVSLAVNYQQYKEKKRLAFIANKSMYMLATVQKSVLVFQRAEINFAFSPDVKDLIQETFTYDSIGQARAIKAINDKGQYFNDMEIVNAFCHE
jgi:hypothetical protein